ncbi:MAG: mechanosensitive ion channel family protein, partial [Acidobacteriia bacterium]|nr:mechanosensitive ion channel family protein [Terriglobia bacterium]
MRIFVIFVVFASLTQVQNTSQEAKDPLGRDSPQSAIFQFLEACHARNYSKAQRYLDLRSLSLAERTKNAPELARQLEDLLDDTPFDISTLSRDPEGDLSDNASADREHLDTFQADGQTLELELERVQLRQGSRVWLVSADSIPLIPKAHQLIRETPFESKLPSILVTLEFLDTPIWRWIALILLALVIWTVAGALSWALVGAIRRIRSAQAFRRPLHVAVAAVGFRAAIEWAPPATLPRLFLDRAMGLILSLIVAWAVAIVIDLLANRWHSRLDPRAQAVSYSVLPLGRQVVKVLVFLIALLSVIGAWGYNTSTILAGLGVGGLAVALAAQKTIENLFGGISVIGDRPVLVGDFCRFGDRVGTIAHIGLRSTRVRTLDRTVISVPNGQFSSMELENFSARDKIWFHPTLSLRRDTTPQQLQTVLSSVEEILKKHPKVEAGDLPVRFVAIGTYSLNVEIFAYVTTADFDEFLRLQQQLLFELLQAVEAAGTA